MKPTILPGLLLEIGSSHLVTEIFDRARNQWIFIDGVMATLGAYLDPFGDEYAHEAGGEAKGSRRMWRRPRRAKNSWRTLSSSTATKMMPAVISG